MIRDALKNHKIGLNPEFRYRGTDSGRLENFSDAVFALAITLLLISTSAPDNFDHIRRFVWELIPFSLCMLFIVLIWHEHFTFFYRYGLRNPRVIVLNSLFLVIVLFYVYPLKFLTKLVLWPIAVLFKQQNLITELSGMIKMSDMSDLMIIYGVGACSVFLVLMLLYKYALSKAEELELNEIELFDTKTKVITNLLMASVPMLSVLTTLVLYSSRFAGMFSGFVYFLYTPIMMIHGKRVDKKRKELLNRIQSTEA